MVCSVSLLEIIYAPRKIAQCLTMGRQIIGITYHLLQSRNEGGAFWVLSLGDLFRFT